MTKFLGQETHVTQGIGETPTEMLGEDCESLNAIVRREIAA